RAEGGLADDRGRPVGQGIPRYRERRPRPPERRRGAAIRFPDEGSGGGRAQAHRRGGRGGAARRRERGRRVHRRRVHVLGDRAHARLPWRRLLEPAIAVARDGHELSPTAGYLHAILDVILRHTEVGRESFGPRGVRLVTGDVLVMPELADTLEQLAEEGGAAF